MANDSRISEKRTEQGYVLLVDRWDDPETGKHYTKGADLPPLTPEDVERFLESNSVAPADTVLAKVARGEIDRSVVITTNNMTSEQLRQQAEVYAALADEREALELGLQGQDAVAFVHAKGKLSGLDVGSDASGNRLRAPSFEASDDPDSYDKQEVQPGARLNVGGVSGQEEEGEGSGGEPKASDAAKREARERGVDTSKIGRAHV